MHGLALASAVQRVEGELVCLRCAMGRGLPGSRLDGTPHRPLLLTSDGRLFIVRDESPASARLEADGPARRHVSVMARLDDSSGLADVVDVLPEPLRPSRRCAVRPARSACEEGVGDPSGFPRDTTVASAPLGRVRSTRRALRSRRGGRAQALLEEDRLARAVPDHDRNEVDDAESVEPEKVRAGG